MADEITFERNFKAVPGVAEIVFPGVQRILAPNPGAFTFTGTCTYIVGDRNVAVIDPGPDDNSHVCAIVEALRGRTVGWIVATHTHRDHTGAVPALRAQVNAKTYGEGPHRAARPLHEGESNPIEAGADRNFIPDIRLKDGDVLTGDGFALEAIATPGHTANHLAFALRGQNCLFSGDHVMGWSTSIVAPPDGSMGDYVQSLKKLMRRPETFYLPGHGAPVQDGPALVDRYIEHRNAREQAILRRLERGETDVPGLVQAIYIGLDPRLTGAAGLTTLAHLENLVTSGVIETDGPPSIDGRYRLA